VHFLLGENFDFRNSDIDLIPYNSFMNEHFPGYDEKKFWHKKDCFCSDSFNTLFGFDSEYDPDLARIKTREMYNYTVFETIEEKTPFIFSNYFQEVKVIESYFNPYKSQKHPFAFSERPEHIEYYTK